MEDAKADRRDFLKTAGAVLTTSIITGRLKGANDRLTAGFIGIGVMGSENLRVALEHGVEVKAVCDVYQPHLERADLRWSLASSSPVLPSASGRLHATILAKPSDLEIRQSRCR